MKGSVGPNGENDGEKTKDTAVFQEQSSQPIQKNYDQEGPKEKVENSSNGFYDLSMKYGNDIQEKTDSHDSDSYDGVSQSTDLRTETAYSESDASKDGSVMNSSSGNEDSYDGFNNNHKVCSKDSSSSCSIVDGLSSDLYPDACNEDGKRAADLHLTTESTSRRKASARKSQIVKKVEVTEWREESDYYDSDLEEYMTPIITTKSDKKQDDSQEKRRKSKRKRKIQLDIDEESDYMCIENFLNSNPEEQVPMQPPKEKKKKKKDDSDPPVPSSPSTPNSKTMQNVKLNLPNGMTRVVSLELPSSGSDSNSMLCSLLTGKRYSSPVKSGKLQLLTQNSNANHQESKVGDPVKKVRFSEQDLSNNMVPKTVDDHCVSNKEERSGGNVPLILENLLTSPHINKSCSISDEVPAVVENEILDLSNPDSETIDMINAGTSAQMCVPRQPMPKPPNFHLFNSNKLKKKRTIDGPCQRKEGETSDNGFSKTLLSYLTSGTGTSDSNSQSIDVEQRREFGGVTVVLSGNTPKATAESAALGVSNKKPKENLAIKMNPSPAPPNSVQNMYYAKLEYIDLNVLYSLQKGRRPIFEIADSDDDDNDVIVVGEGVPPKSSSKLESSKNITCTPSATNQKRPSQPSGQIKSALPGVNASVLKESTSSKHNKSPGKSSEHKAKVKMNNNKKTPVAKTAVDHDMKDGLIESISFTVSKLNENPISKPVQLKSLLIGKHKTKTHKKLNTPSEELQTAMSTVEKKKPGKATVSLIKPKSPISSSQGNATNNRVYSSLLTGNSYVVKPHSQAVPLPGKKTKV